MDLKNQHDFKNHQIVEITTILLSIIQINKHKTIKQFGRTSTKRHYNMNRQYEIQISLTPKPTAVLVNILFTMECLGKECLASQFYAFARATRGAITLLGNISIKSGGQVLSFLIKNLPILSES